MKVLKKSLMVAALSLGLAFVGSNAFAQTCGGKGEPPCEPPKDSADCSPGYYKKHEEVWCGTCVGGVQTTCDAIVVELSAELGSSRDQREAAKAILDACYGTAEASPCQDDD